MKIPFVALVCCGSLAACTSSSGGSSSSSSSSSTSSGGVTSSSSAPSSLVVPSSSVATSGVATSSSVMASSASTMASSSVASSSGGGACGAGRFESWWDNACGGGQDTTVSCQPVSASCVATGEVCGCDGITYPSECAAQQAGVDLDDRGACTAPSGKFRCGAHFCAEGKYCVHTGDLMGIPDNFVCNPLPASCNGVADCTCVRFAQCGEESMVGPAGTCVAVTGGVINRCLDARFY